MSHPVVSVTVPRAFNFSLNATPSADVATTRYGGYIGSPSSKTSAYNASSQRANTSACTHSSVPIEDARAPHAAIPGAASATRSEKRRKKHSSDIGAPSTATSRSQKLRRKNQCAQTPAPATNTNPLLASRDVAKLAPCHPLAAANGHVHGGAPTATTPATPAMAHAAAAALVGTPPRSPNAPLAAATHAPRPPYSATVTRT